MAHQLDQVFYVQGIFIVFFMHFLQSMYDIFSFLLMCSQTFARYNRYEEVGFPIRKFYHNLLELLKFITTSEFHDIFRVK